MRKKLEAMAVDYLRQQKNRNINLLSALQGGLAEVKAATERGCLLCTAGRIWQIAAADTQTALEFSARCRQTQPCWRCRTPFRLNPIAQRFQPACIETYYNAWYEKASITVPEIGIQVHTAQLEDAPRLAPYYHMPGPAAGDVASVEHYLYDRIRSGAVVLCFLGRCAGWICRHPRRRLHWTADGIARIPPPGAWHVFGTGGDSACVGTGAYSLWANCRT